MTTQLPTLEELAAEAAVVDLDNARAASAPAQAPQPRPLVPCAHCGGTGMDVTRFAFLWGHDCWVCGGWGFMPRSGVWRGPFARDPRRHTW